MNLEQLTATIGALNLHDDGSGVVDPFKADSWRAEIIEAAPLLIAEIERLNAALRKSIMDATTMQLFTGRGKHPEHGGHYEVTIAATSRPEALRVLAEYQQDDCEGVLFEITREGNPFPRHSTVIAVSESGV